MLQCREVGYTCVDLSRILPAHAYISLGDNLFWPQFPFPYPSKALSGEEEATNTNSKSDL